MNFNVRGVCSICGRDIGGVPQVYIGEETGCGVENALIYGNRDINYKNEKTDIPKNCIFK